MRTRGLAIVIGVVFFATPAAAEFTKCKLTYSLSGWSVFYKKYDGTGRVTCDNGESSNVRIESRGGGISFGKSEVDNGRGTFSKVRDISEIYGTYFVADANAGVGPAVDSAAMTKGAVSLVLSGKGRGTTLGFSLGGFTIKRM
jgi:hypothetical protein